MADVFLSYRNLDDRRKLVTRFATILRAYEISVWWDYGLAAGDSYRDQIAAELSTAKIVIPFWCEESVASKWVLMEAEMGRTKLMPVRLQRVAPPSEFEAIHAAHLEAWDGSILDPQVDEFVRRICERLGRAPRLAPDTRAELSRLPKLKPLPAAQLALPKSSSASPTRRSGGIGAAFWTISILALFGGGAGAAAWYLDPLQWKAAVFSKRIEPAGQPVASESAVVKTAPAADVLGTTAASPGANPPGVSTPSASAPSTPLPASSAPTISTAPGQAQPAAPPAKAGPSEAKKAWAKVGYNGAIEDIRKFVATYGDSPDAKSGKDRLRELDELAWSSAKNYDWALFTREYLRDFPEGANPPGLHTKEAVARLGQLDAEEKARETPVKERREKEAAEASARDPAKAFAASSGGPVSTRTFRERLTSGGYGPEVIAVPAGSFKFGSPESGRQAEVTIKYRLAVGKYEVTWDEYELCVRAGACEGSPYWRWGKGARPVNARFSDATAYAAWLSKETGHRYRLLSETEWEYAARAGTTTTYWWGDTASPAWALYLGPGTRRGATSPVGMFPANPFGLYDVLGNSDEFVLDSYAPNYMDLVHFDGRPFYSKSNERFHVTRGGSDVSTADLITSSSRFFRDDTGIVSSAGFRITREE